MSAAYTFDFGPVKTARNISHIAGESFAPSHHPNSDAAQALLVYVVELCRPVMVVVVAPLDEMIALPANKPSGLLQRVPSLAVVGGLSFQILEGLRFPRPHRGRETLLCASFKLVTAKRIAEPVRLHVAAKRYLCAVDPVNSAQLSPTSVQSLALQGGPLTEVQAREFERLPRNREALQIRRPNDAAKQPGLDLYGRAVQFFAVDTVEVTEAELQWLDAELAKSTAPWKVVFGHYHIYSATRGDNKVLIDKLLPILTKRHVDIYLNLQEERPEGSVHFFVSGGGGAELYEFTSYDRAIFKEKLNGFTVLDATAGRFTVVFVGTDGREIYRRVLLASDRGSTDNVQEH